MNLKRSLKVIGLIVLASTIVFLGQSARLLYTLGNDQLTIEYAAGSPANGQAYVGVNNQFQPVWLAVSWRWCPSINPLRWCIDANGDVGEAVGKLSLGLGAIKLTDAFVSASNLDLLIGFVPVAGSFEASISSAVVANKPGLEAVETIEADILVSDIDAVGYLISPHKLSIKRQADEKFTATVDGDIANGSADITPTGQYSTNILLTPPDNLAGLLTNQLPAGPNGSFQYKVSGTAPLKI